MTDEEFIARIRATPTLLSIMLQIDDALEARDKEVAERSARIAELEAALMNKRDVTLEEAALEIERVGHSEYPNKLITDGYVYAVRSLKGMPRAAERTSAALSGEKK